MARENQHLFCLFVCGLAVLGGAFEPARGAADSSSKRPALVQSVQKLDASRLFLRKKIKKLSSLQRDPDYQRFRRICRSLSRSASGQVEVSGDIVFKQEIEEVNQYTFFQETQIQSAEKFLKADLNKDMQRVSDSFTTQWSQLEELLNKEQKKVSNAAEVRENLGEARQLAYIFNRRLERGVAEAARCLSLAYDLESYGHALKLQNEKRYARSVYNSYQNLFALRGAQGFNWLKEIQLEREFDRRNWYFDGTEHYRSLQGMSFDQATPHQLRLAKFDLLVRIARFLKDSNYAIHILSNDLQSSHENRQKVPVSMTKHGQLIDQKAFLQTFVKTLTHKKTGFLKNPWLKRKKRFEKRWDNWVRRLHELPSQS